MQGNTQGHFRMSIMINGLLARLRPSQWRQTEGPRGGPSRARAHSRDESRRVPAQGGAGSSTLSQNLSLALAPEALGRWPCRQLRRRVRLRRRCHRGRGGHHVVATGGQSFSLFGSAAGELLRRVRLAGSFPTAQCFECEMSARGSNLANSDHSLLRKLSTDQVLEAKPTRGPLLVDALGGNWEVFLVVSITLLEHDVSPQPCGLCVLLAPNIVGVGGIDELASQFLAAPLQCCLRSRSIDLEERRQPPPIGDLSSKRQWEV
mmetsp:Transcript_55076/g.120473  ORF Transcript_55076/g.120473 Transcript_55076/m.120473 type:complete len:262 (+) Transcript_55076:504-1289(+)